MFKKFIIFNLFINLLLIYSIKCEKFARDGQFPWHVSIEIQVEYVNSYYCSGVLISKNWIITAAECLDEAQNVIINFGSVTRNQSKLQISSSNFIIHPQYTLAERDIGLIKLPRKIQFTENIKPILLAKKSMNYGNLINKNCIISGFVKGQDGLENLKFTKLQILSKQNCRFLPFLVFGGDTMCATGAEGNQQSSTCIGESGSGLVFKQNNQFYLIGINTLQLTSRCSKRSSIIFQSIQMNLNWISKITGIKVDK